MKQVVVQEGHGTWLVVWGVMVMLRIWWVGVLRCEKHLMESMCILGWIVNGWYYYWACGEYLPIRRRGHPRSGIALRRVERRPQTEGGIGWAPGGPRSGWFRVATYGSSR